MRLAMTTSKQTSTRANKSKRAKEANGENREKEIGKERANKMARVKWGRGKREANGK